VNRGGGDKHGRLTLRFGELDSAELVAGSRAVGGHRSAEVDGAGFRRGGSDQSVATL
jgi:hypothetical protein